MKSILWIGLAGLAGAITRVLLGQLIHSESGFPMATLSVNIAGTFVLCFIVAGALRKISVNRQLYDAVTTGFLGSFTTFSALTMETVSLVDSGQILLAAVYVILSIIGGLATGVFGFYLGDRKVRA